MGEAEEGRGARGPSGTPEVIPAIPLLWTLGVLALWATGLALLPLDPDYTSGELLDHLLAWRETGVLYPDPSTLPHRVLNYPPLFLVLVRGLAVLGIPMLLAGRILGTLGVAAALWVLRQWLRERGAGPGAAWWGVALAGASFPLLYSAGQLHLEGWAAAATLAGFWIAGRRGSGWGWAAGLLLALGCFFKQTQVVLSLVALAWMWRRRPGSQAGRALVAFGLAGVVGSGFLTLAFGTEAWRHLVALTVGTFSPRQLGVQWLSFVVSWPVMVPLAFLAALAGQGPGAVPRPGDAGRWYLFGSAAWLFSSARLGSSYSYFLDFHLAVILWVAPLLVAAGEGPAPPVSTGRRGSRFYPAWWRRLVVVQFVGAALVVDGVLAWNLATTMRTAGALPVLCPHVAPAPDLTVSGSPGLVRACGGRPALHPFIMASLARQGLWDPSQLEGVMAAGALGEVLLPFDPGGALTGAEGDRWTEPFLALFRDRYRTVARAGGWWVLAPVTSLPPPSS